MPLGGFKKGKEGPEAMLKLMIVMHVHMTCGIFGILEGSPQGRFDTALEGSAQLS